MPAPGRCERRRGAFVDRSSLPPRQGEDRLTTILVRERPPTALSVCVTPPAGGPSYRWGNDSPDVAYAPDDISFSTSLPGGFSTFSCTLNRSRYVTWPDEQEFANLTVLGLGGRTVAWQGRLEQLPDQQGFQAQVNPQASGLAGAPGRRRLGGDDLRRSAVDELGRSVRHPADRTCQRRTIQLGLHKLRVRSD